MKNTSLMTMTGLLVLSLVFSGCWEDDEALTGEEALEALGEIALSNSALTLTSGTVEISTNFTIGQGVEAAAEELKVFIETQLPCAEVTLTGSTLTVEYGALPGTCYYHGRTYSGVHAVTVSSAAEGDLVVDHSWTSLSDGTIEVSGTAHVTWSTAASSRTVEHDLTWTRISDGIQRQGTGDRVHTPLAEGILVGIEENGVRSWISDKGSWDLSIEDLEMRWQDPVPQLGSLGLETPSGKSLNMEFERVDEDTIKVTVTSGGASFDFNVSSWGKVS